MSKVQKHLVLLLIMNIKVSGGANKDVGNFIAFQDKTNNGLDATDYQVESKVEFVKKKIASVHIAGTQTVATNSYATFDLTFKDEEGKTAKLKKADGVNLVVQVLDMEGNIVGDLTSPTHKLEMETDMESRANNTADWAEIQLVCHRLGQQERQGNGCLSVVDFRS